MRKQIKKVVVVSGYFDPIHEGHISLLKEAITLGDYVIAILGTDKQLIGKKGFYLIDQYTRFDVLCAMEYVDQVNFSIDTDGTVCETLGLIRETYNDCKMIFANGGDRTNENIPEKKVCEELGIELRFNVGGSKSNASSLIIQEGFERYSNTHQEDRPWGNWKIINQGPGFKIKILEVEPGKSLSAQSHNHRDEHWVVIQGRALVMNNGVYNNGGNWFNNRCLDVNESIDIPRESVHQLINYGDEVLRVVEVSTGDYLKEDDIVRYNENTHLAVL